MNKLINYIFIFLIILGFLFFNDNIKLNDKFVNYIPDEYPNTPFNYQLPKPYKLSTKHKPKITFFNGGNPMLNEMHVGEYYNNDSLLLLHNTDNIVKPECCTINGQYSTSSGCICN